MNCYECSRIGVTASAVAICPTCGVAQCMEHKMAADRHTVGGMRYGCAHQTVVRSKVGAVTSTAALEKVTTR